MTFINTDGLSFIGPGSEWFWTAVSGLVLAVTFIAIYRQLRLQRAAAGYAQITELSRQDQAEPMLRMKLDILRALHDGCEPTAIPYGAASYVTDFYEDVGALIRMGFVDKRLVHESMGTGCRKWWATLRPFVEQVRIEAGPRTVAHFEWLAKEMATLDLRTGDTTTYDQAYLARTLDAQIRNAGDRLAIAEELRGFTLRPPTGAVIDSTVDTLT